jgi:hypothetical protein
MELLQNFLVDYPVQVVLHDSKNINQILGLNSPESIRLFINRSFSDLRFSSAELVNCSFASNLGVLIIFLVGNFFALISLIL